MRTKSFRLILLLLPLVALFYGCQQDKGELEKRVDFVVNVTTQYDELGGKVVEATGKLTDINNQARNYNMEYNHSTNQLTAKVPTGQYSLTSDAIVEIGDSTVTVSTSIPSFEITEATPKQEVKMLKSDSYRGTFMFTEIKTTQLRVGKKSYLRDKYFVITNNSTSVQYADGLAIGESEFISTRRVPYVAFNGSVVVPLDSEADMANRDDVLLCVLYKIPGNGTDYPVEPGKSIYIAERPFDHSNGGAVDACNTADATWEIYSEDPTGQDEDDPTVPNLDLVYTYSRSYWMPHSQQTKAFVLARIPADTSKFMCNYQYAVLPTAPIREKRQPLIPASWVVDAVVFCGTGQPEWRIVPNKLDMGFVPVPKTEHKAAVRKFKMEGGVKVYQKTNSSSRDFEVSDPVWGWRYKK